MHSATGSTKRDPAGPGSHDGERSLVERLRAERYFSREARLDEIAGLLSGLAWCLGLIFFSGAPGQGMQPLVVQIGGVWWRYSLIGNLALVLVCLRYRRAVPNGFQAIVLALVLLLSLLHGLTSWHDPWGVFFSNTFVEWLLLIAVSLLVLPWTGQVGGRAGWALLSAGWSAAILAGLFSCAVHAMTLLGLAARRLIVRLLAGAGAAGLLPWFRWSMALAAFCLVLLVLHLRRQRAGLDPGLARLRKTALLDMPAHKRRLRRSVSSVFLLLIWLAPGGLQAGGLISSDALLEGELTQGLLRTVFSRLGSSGMRYEFLAVTNGLDDETGLLRRPVRDWRDGKIADEVQAALATNGWAHARARLGDLSAGARGLAALLRGKLLLGEGQREGAARAFADCLVLDPAEYQAWHGLAEAGCDPLRILFRTRARAVRTSSRVVTVLYDASLGGSPVRYVWISYALARALYRFEGLWQTGAVTGDWYEETMDEHLFAWRVAVANWKGHKTDNRNLADSFFDRITGFEAEGLLAGFVWFECWRPPSPLAALRARLRYARSIEKYCTRMLLRPARQS